MSDGPRAGTAEPGTRGDTADGIGAALARARRHARSAASESVLAVRALLDAVSLLQGVPAESNRVLEKAAAWLDRLAAGLAPDGAGDGALTKALAAALDAEILRWEQRAQEDPDARAVLRAFLGLRELLWELGVRAAGVSSEEAADAPARRGGGARKRRVERVPVRG